MKKCLLISLILFSISAGFMSCQSDDPTDTVDLIHVVRDGAKLPAYIYGNTQSKVFVIVLHGGPGGSGLGYRFGQFSEVLESQYAMVYLDQRGQGMAQGSYDLENLTVENMAGDVDALAQILKIKYGGDISLFLLGHSWGGMLGTEVMINEDYRAQFNGWIEVSGAHDFPKVILNGFKDIVRNAEEQILVGNNIDFWQTTLDSLSNSDTLNLDSYLVNSLAFTCETVLQEDGYIGESDVSKIWKDLEISLFVNNPSTSYISGIIANQGLFKNGLEEYSLTDDLQKIDLPSLLLWGKYDLVVSPTIGVEAFDLIGSTNKELVIFENSGHNPMSTEADLFNTAVINFIEEYK